MNRSDRFGRELRTELIFQMSRTVQNHYLVNFYENEQAVGTSSVFTFDPYRYPAEMLFAKAKKIAKEMPYVLAPAYRMLTKNVPARQLVIIEDIELYGEYNTAEILLMLISKLQGTFCHFFPAFVLTFSSDHICRGNRSLESLLAEYCTVRNYKRTENTCGVTYYRIFYPQQDNQYPNARNIPKKYQNGYQTRYQTDVE